MTRTGAYASFRHGKGRRAGTRARKGGKEHQVAALTAAKGLRPVSPPHPVMPG